MPFLEGLPSFRDCLWDVFLHLLILVFMDYISDQLTYA